MVDSENQCKYEIRLIFTSFTYKQTLIVHSRSYSDARSIVVNHMCVAVLTNGETTLCESWHSSIRAHSGKK